MEAPVGGLVAYADVLNRSYVSVSVHGYAHPEHRGHGIGGYLVRGGIIGLAGAWVWRSRERWWRSSSRAKEAF